jgi:hypothetical protein
VKYDINLHNLSRAERRRFASILPPFYCPRLRRWLGIRAVLELGYPPLGTVPLLEPAHVPPPLLRASEEALADCAGRSAWVAFYVMSRFVQRRGKYAEAELLTGDRLVHAALQYEEGEYPEITCTCFSGLQGARWLMTTDRPDYADLLDFPPAFAREVLPHQRAYPADVLERHYERVEAAGGAPAVVPISCLEDFILELDRQITEFHVRRGVFVPAGSQGP